MAYLRESATTKIATIQNINAKTVGNNELFYVPTGKFLVVESISIRCTSFTSGGKSIQAVASFGGNSATYDDYLNSVTYTIANSNVVIRDAVLNSAVPIYSSGTSFRISIETSSDATTESWSIDLFGYLGNE